MSSLTEEQRQRIEANKQKALALRKEKIAAAAAQTRPGIVFNSIKSFTPKPVVLNTDQTFPSVNVDSIPKLSAAPISFNNSKVPNPNKNYDIEMKSTASVSSLSAPTSKPLNPPLKSSTQSSLSSRFSYNAPSSMTTSSNATDKFYGNKIVTQHGNQTQSFSSNATVKSGIKASNQAFKTGVGTATSVTRPDSSSTHNINTNKNVSNNNVLNVVHGTLCLTSVDTFTAKVQYHTGLIEVFKTMPSRKYDADTKQWSFSIDEHTELMKKIKALEPAVRISPLPANVLKVLKEAKSLPPLHSVDISGLDPLLRDSLLPYQLDGVRFGLRRGGRVLIADDMGLGKTIQALGIAACYRRDWPLLIVTPSSVRYAWQDALMRWMSSFSCCVINTSQDPLSGFDVIITTYELLSRRAKEFKDRNFGVIIMDESHMLKNFKSARYKAASPLMKQAARVILLSGTPALSRPSELYTQIASVDSKLFPKYQDYGIRYCDGKMNPWGWDFSGSSNLSELQILLEAKIMIRRLKSEVLDQLPGKQRKTVLLDATSIETSSNEAMAASAQQMGLRSLKGVERHSALLQFFSHTAQAKLKAVCKYVQELLEAGQKFLVFAHHKMMLQALCRTCEKCKSMLVNIITAELGNY
ncbi:SWI/SNF-related matrix-associated actin-dependent regulator of chromatin subfamily A-like protein 1 isoform X2 [Hyalella azteca]|uniref:SWI/SNF-related matrix-associated actin-dependent regulator of chromatin subfamily A-like protein 1 isoform X2 n=1 Tax=Hyalella azteca TaxID=294128 RepID=A0A8B7NDN7_HYAAZ|nr:SWI/SNF-related matrix-associated actin-dependent regulator of chromatin subfamily A-like protein 1 isoform X2 [Hyalella azteca]